MFRVDGLLYRIGTFVFQFTYLNMLFLLSCLPIITIFPATAAMFGVVRQWVKKNDPSIFFTFFKLFKENFKQSIITGIVMMIIGCILILDYQHFVQIHSSNNSLTFIFLCLLGFVYSSTSLYIFPFMVNGYYSNRQLVLNAFKFGLYRIHFTILNIVCLLGFLYISLRFTFILIFFFSSVSAFITYWFAELKFAKLIVQQTLLSTSTSNEQEHV